jgi:hypothetical protein
MESHERWLDRSVLRATYEHHPNHILPKPILFEYCDDSVTNAFRFLGASDVEASLPAITQPSSTAVQYEDDRSIVWVAANQEELYELYPDEWILVEGEAVVAHSADPLELQEIADKQGITTAFMARVAPPSKPGRSIYAR